MIEDRQIGSTDGTSVDGAGRSSDEIDRSLDRPIEPRTDRLPGDQRR
jgi:hypothetical protein